MENSEHDALCWTANDRAEIAAAYQTEQESQFMNTYA